MQEILDFIAPYLWIQFREFKRGVLLDIKRFGINNVLTFNKTQISHEILNSISSETQWIKLIKTHLFRDEKIDSIFINFLTKTFYQSGLMHIARSTLVLAIEKYWHQKEHPERTYYVPAQIQLIADFSYDNNVGLLTISQNVTFEFNFVLLEGNVVDATGDIEAKTGRPNFSLQMIFALSLEQISSFFKEYEERKLEKDFLGPLIPRECFVSIVAGMSASIRHYLPVIWQRLSRQDKLDFLLKPYPDLSRDLTSSNSDLSDDVAFNEVKHKLLTTFWSEDPFKAVLLNIHASEQEYNLLKKELHRLKQEVLALFFDDNFEEKFNRIDILMTDWAKKVSSVQVLMNDVKFFLLKDVLEKNINTVPNEIYPILRKLLVPLSIEVSYETSENAEIEISEIFKIFSDKFKTCKKSIQKLQGVLRFFRRDLPIIKDISKILSMSLPRLVHSDGKQPGVRTYLLR